ncbi:MAG TPA: HPr kinase/phosphatase C-terminal domain-containing protein [Stellaceae bacterium]|jgi:serine kinase of HPr protein (carbohydrate metabolism regulator)
MNGTILVHATAVAIDGEALLLRGPAGAGKSDLALRLIDGGARLVADDQAVLRRLGDRVLVRAPAVIAGLIEVRGFGIVRVEAIQEAPLALIVDLLPSDRIERMPQRRVEPVLGLEIGLIELAAFEASAAAKLRLVRRALAATRLPAIIGR